MTQVLVIAFLLPLVACGSPSASTQAICGDGVALDKEGCDDGNLVDGDGCSGECYVENGYSCRVDADCVSGICNLLGGRLCAEANECGNGQKDLREACDDGALEPGDGCSSRCLFEVDVACEQDTQCDSGVCNSQGSQACELANECGNGRVEDEETCDDGNNLNEDGCSSTCLLEVGVSCDKGGDCESGVCDLLESMQCEPKDTCGNGQIELTETCDDGNIDAGDGCDPVCAREPLALGNPCSEDAECESQLCLNDCANRQATYIKAEDAISLDEFGTSVSVDGDLMVVGAPKERSCATGVNGTRNDGSCGDVGAAYIFRRSAIGQWMPEAYLKPSSSRQEEFGASVAVAGNLVLVGAPREWSCSTGVDSVKDAGCSSVGAAYLFEFDGTKWNSSTYFKPSHATLGMWFGNVVALSGDAVAIGALNEKSCADGVGGNELDDNCPSAGAVYIFRNTAGEWDQEAYIKAPNSETGFRFGQVLALDGNTLVVGSKHESNCADGIGAAYGDNNCAQAGAAYVYLRTGTQWDLEAYIKQNASEPGRLFGGAIDVDGDRLVVGSVYDSSCATMIDGDQTDTACPLSGAAFTFLRSGSTWSAESYFKPSNLEKNDNFGDSVALSGNLMLVSSASEDSCFDGYDAYKFDNGCDLSGAAYLFQHDGSVWVERAMIKATNSEANDRFGNAMAIDRSTMAIAAKFEDSAARQIDGNQMDNSLKDSGAVYVWDAY